MRGCGSWLTAFGACRGDGPKGWACGAGPERAELVVSALKKGHSVRLADSSGAGLVEILNRVAALQEAMVTQNLISPEARDADWARLETGQRAGILSGCNLILVAQGDVPMAEIGAGVLGVSLGQWSGVTSGWARLLPPKGFGEHAELGEPRDPAARAGLPLLLDFGRTMGWRFQVLGGAGFVSPALLACQQALTARLSSMGYKGAVLTAGLILLRSDLRRLDGPGRVAPCALFDRMIAEGARFYP